MPLPAYSPGDLYLTNFAVNGPTNYLAIHWPTNVTDGLNLFYTTNLSPPISWHWLMATPPGQTNLTVTNATDPQRFYVLGKTNSSAGTDFWVAFMGTIAGQGATCTLYISSQVASTGTVSNPYGGLAFTSNFTVTPRTVTNITLPYWATISTNVNGLVEEFGIHITASQPVSVYGVSFAAPASTALTFYPTPMLGTSYCLMARPAGVASPPDFAWCSQFAIVATETNTTVTITPPTNANLAWYNGVVSNTMTMNQGETFQIASSNWSSDVTGTLITSDKPIGVFAGANAAYVPNANTGEGNPLEQEQVPVNAWGRQTLALSFGRPGGDSFRVLAATDDTTVTTLTVNGAATNSLGAGQ